MCIHTCDMTYPVVWHDPSRCVTCLIHSRLVDSCFFCRFFWRRAPCIHTCLIENICTNFFSLCRPFEWLDSFNYALIYIRVSLKLCVWILLLLAVDYVYRFFCDTCADLAIIWVPVLLLSVFFFCNIYKDFYAHVCGFFCFFQLIYMCQLFCHICTDSYGSSSAICVHILAYICTDSPVSCKICAQILLFDVVLPCDESYLSLAYGVALVCRMDQIIL